MIRKPFEIDKGQVEDAALARLDELLRAWLPGGRLVDGNREWECGGLDGRPGRGLKVNLRTGVWRDFSGDIGGKGAISLCAAIHGIPWKAALLAVAEQVRVGQAEARPMPAARPRVEEPEEWTPIIPVPPEAPYYGRELIDPRWGHARSVWEYRSTQGHLLWVAVRWLDERGRKEQRPLSWCRSPDGRCAWRRKKPAQPWPLYRLHAMAPGPVLLCEGEKAADAATTWWPSTIASPFGAGNEHHADWSPVAGRMVWIWPDADAPGTAYAASVTRRLWTMGCSIRWLDLEQLQRVLCRDHLPQGFDAADLTEDDVEALAIAGGIEPLLVSPPPLDDTGPDPLPPCTEAPAGAGDWLGGVS